MKQKYIKPIAKVADFETATMISTSVTTGVGNTPSRPDANAVRGEWGNLWDKN